LYELVEEFFPNASYTGVDKSGESINQARSRFLTNSIFHDLNSENWKRYKYDLIFSAGVFHHIPHNEHKNLLQDLSSHLNPKGILAIWEHNPFNPFTKKIVNDCILDQDAVLIYPHRMRKNMLEIPLSNTRVVYTTFFPKILSCLNVLDPYLNWLPLGGQFLAYGEKI
jgi:trans-aconitate methyltransferase